MGFRDCLTISIRLGVVTSLGDPSHLLAGVSGRFANVLLCDAVFAGLPDRLGQLLPEDLGSGFGFPEPAGQMGE